MNIFWCLNKILNFSDEKILDMSLNDFWKKMNNYNFNYDEIIIILGIILNKSVINQTKTQLNLVAKNYQEAIIIDFAIFAYIFIGDEFNDRVAISNLKIDLKTEESNFFITTLNTLINSSSRIFNLSGILGNNNDRANMFAVNALLNIKQGLGLDNFHITLFTIYQSLELKLKHCLKKYIDNEPSAQKKQINFHNLVRLVKLISTSRITDSEMIGILKDLREYLRYFEKINPGGQAARYEAAPNTNYFNENNYSSINEKELLENFAHALSLLQSLYLKLIEIYDDSNSQNHKKTKTLDTDLAQLIGANSNDDDNQINNKLLNLLDYQVFGDYQELVNLSYQELLTLRFLVRIGFFQRINEAVNQLVK